MSIGSLQSNPWPNPWDTATAAQTGTAGNAAAASEISQFEETVTAWASNGALSGQDATATNAPSANPLQNLASDIQAMLIQAQSAAGADDTPTTADPVQSVATDLQTILGGSQSGGAANSQTANANPTAPTGQTEQHHHHHHHHDGDGEANAATDVAAASGSAGAGSPTTTQLSSDQAVSSIFASDIAQAIESYGSNISSTAISGLMV